MTNFAIYFSNILSVLTALGQILILVLLFSFVFKKEFDALAFFKKNALVLSFITVLAGTILSLTYSNIIGFAPCKLCYIQRFFLYPQLLILGIALFKKNKWLINFALILSIFGAAVAAYHYYGQMFNSSVLTCSIQSNGASLCSQIPFIEFGYITIPMFSLTTFLMIVALLLSEKRKNPLE